MNNIFFETPLCGDDEEGSCGDCGIVAVTVVVSSTTRLEAVPEESQFSAPT